MRRTLSCRFKTTLVSGLAIAWACTAFAGQSPGAESGSPKVGGTTAAASGVNLAVAAEPSGSYVSGDTTLAALQAKRKKDFTPREGGCRI